MFKSPTNFRLFNSEGVEIFDNDIQYIKNQAILFMSNGAPFDEMSCFRQYQILNILG